MSEQRHHHTSNHTTYRKRPAKPAKTRSADNDSTRTVANDDTVFTDYPDASRKKREMPHSGYPEHKKKKPIPPRRRRHPVRNFLIALILILAVIGIILTVSLRSVFRKIEGVELDSEQIIINDSVTAQDKNINDYINIALFGVDNQDNVIGDTGSRTDCIIVASIKKSSKKVKLMSIYRDTYVSINGQYDKINAAYSYGGPELAISTINRNLDLNITDFATVNFKALADAVDILGGIPLTIQSEKELKNLNDYIGNMNKINGGNSPKFDSTGTFTFDGNQAVAYSRIRYMEGGDHARASHQRLVVEGIMKQAKKKPWKLKALVDKVIPQCKTSLSTKEMSRMALSLPRYDIADSQAYPFDSFDEKYNGIYYGFPTTATSNTIKAHEYLFGTKNYEPTEEQQKISAKLEAVVSDLGY